MITELIAGDSYTFPLSYSDYLATSGYVVTFVLRGPSTLSTTAQANGDDYTVTLPSAKTANLPAGTYQYAVTATKAGERKTVDNGFITVTADLVNTNSKILDLEKRVRIIDARLDNRITSDMESYSIAGRSVTRIPIDELLKLRALAYRELAQMTGREPSRTILVNFTGVR